MATIPMPAPLHASLFDSRASPQDLADLMDEEDLYEGTSHGPSYRGVGGARPLSVASLLETRMHFVPPQNEQRLDEIPYTAVNVQKAQPTANGASSTVAGAAASSSSPKPSLPPPASGLLSKVPASPFFPSIAPTVSWAKQHAVGSGLDNTGNTCFLNSALQVLIHTPPLVRYLEENKGHCRGSECEMLKKKGFCMTCAMWICVQRSFEKPSSYTPRPFTNNLKKIAQHFRIGRQEDSHEFLRFCIDGMQNSALFGKPPKLDQKIKESTFIHQIFGGRLRSRVQCDECGHPSDTFDSILDLSLDVSRVDSIRDALNTFVKVDQLRGSNKYKCEKCKKLVNATKNFTIHEAPMVLTIHLKRFTPSGNKIGGMIKYPELLDLSPFMSKGSESPTYRLYGVVSHQGGGPHSGHYTAYAKSPRGAWHCFNDSHVEQIGKVPINAKSAYLLFYCRDRGDSLKAAIHAPAQQPKANGVAHNGYGNGFANGVSRGGNENGKRPRESHGDAGGSGAGQANGHGDAPASKKPFIGPRSPFAPTPPRQSNNGPSGGMHKENGLHKRSPSGGRPMVISTTGALTKKKLVAQMQGRSVAAKS